MLQCQVVNAKKKERNHRSKHIIIIIILPRERGGGGGGGEYVYFESRIKCVQVFTGQGMSIECHRPSN